ncbi:hypothetical protein GQX73_g3832 [Xylaria multiplex]|uniref:Extradiol ring-cleavage dioxygenase class III enzyme subunit B domain-containing protein n=1 Tax=Xylaria multiplex TaxID=323545 RepID=A0A7C8MVN8_9PEZI|nr:hypothetical protein GQX73_g3832 [Xylaria multiplex]
MVPPSPLHRHQSSLEGVIDFSMEPPLGIDQRSVAKDKFNRIINHYDTNDPSNCSSYNRSKLIRCTYQYALSEQSRDNLLRAFFQAMTLSVDNDEEDINFDELRPNFFGFAEYLLDYFFFPLKASGRKTPQPTPTYHSVVREVQGVAHGFVETPARVSALRGACLLRDRFRCVVSRKFDLHEAENRFAHDNDSARDNDENLLEGEPLDCLEDSAREAALAVLNMFDHGVVNLIEGTDIDRPRNALTLTHQLHVLFSDFKVFFEPVQDEQQLHTYHVKSFLHPFTSRNLGLPVIRTFYLTDTRTIDPPSPRLLAVHRAIAHILHLSAAGEYIDRLLRDMDEKGIQADGSTDPNTMFDTEHPVYPVLQRIGQEITQKVKPKAIVVFSAHWEAGPRDIQVNTALMNDLIYEFVLASLILGRCSPEIASHVIELLGNAGIKAEGVKRGLDHGVYVGFSVAFHPEKNPLNIPIVQVSQYNSPDVDQHYRLGQAVQALREENILIIGAGMSVHNLRDLRFMYNSTKPLPYVKSFDEALKPAMEASPSERQARLAEVAKRPDAHQAHPHFDHLMPAYITAGAAGEDVGKQLWTYHETSMGWAMYRFGDVPA